MEENVKLLDFTIVIKQSLSVEQKIKEIWSKARLKNLWNWRGLSPQGCFLLQKESDFAKGKQEYSM